MKKACGSVLSNIFEQRGVFPFIGAASVGRKSLHTDVRVGLLSNSPLETNELSDLKSPRLEFRGSNFDFPCLNRRLVWRNFLLF